MSVKPVAIHIDGTGPKQQDLNYTYFEQGMFVFCSTLLISLI